MHASPGGQPAPATDYGTTGGADDTETADTVSTPPSCKFYLTPEDLQRLDHAGRQSRGCRKESCSHAHSVHVSKMNCDRLLRQIRKQSTTKANKQRPTPWDAERRGYIQTYDQARAYGFIMPNRPDPGGQRRKQRIYFHAKDWSGKGAPLVGAAVRYIRAPDDRAQGKWKAINVSFLGNTTQLDNRKT